MRLDPSERRLGRVLLFLGWVAKVSIPFTMLPSGLIRGRVREPQGFERVGSGPRGGPEGSTLVGGAEVAQPNGTAEKRNH